MQAPFHIRNATLHVGEAANQAADPRPAVTVTETPPVAITARVQIAPGSDLPPVAREFTAHGDTVADVVEDLDEQIRGEVLARKVNLDGERHRLAAASHALQDMVL